MIYYDAQILLIYPLKIILKSKMRFWVSSKEPNIAEKFGTKDKNQSPSTYDNLQSREN